ncbi:DUF2620 domain-containing protein [Pediococcus acidilactici]|uniref:DUF2620 domain-containing protein n=1 Tax=Pediococcus acidilactici TaxID=1254 RepID=UPI00132902CD|nr:DUF2620 domain-containing protein [Pediococcus acidilactici]KAF0370164.1 DUF2620 family protein [Pediococcus acidilactici]KAF0381937.1 DUF2620 family protein [Pediococcus acidilactici]KAF0455141.1 DUF2620 family protein [Pediococcus acidilactici]KAF0477296.1 DUF2620 family protein [Pediococcus acidilactici]KAF0538114.1 DUF2620 family protein [Pediococcus acidilactici]
MIKIVIGGQMGKEEIKKDLLELIGDEEVDIEIKNDLDAAMTIQNGEADYYIGACETGAGGALAMATALLGSTKTVTIASPSKMLSEEQIADEIKNKGKVAFGFTINTKDEVLPKLAKYLVAN